MINKKVFKNSILLPLFLIFILSILSIHIILSKSIVKGQEKDSLLSYLPENFRVLFVNNQSSVLNNTDLSNQSSTEPEQSRIEEQFLAINVLEDLPRGSTRIEDIDNQTQIDILMNNSGFKQIQTIIENKAGMNQIS